MSKYVIKNCPCRMELHENDCFGHTGYNNCCACPDCVMKKIVELAKGYKDELIDRKTKKVVATRYFKLTKEILDLLDIEECE